MSNLKEMIQAAKSNSPPPATPTKAKAKAAKPKAPALNSLEQARSYLEAVKARITEAEAAGTDATKMTSLMRELRMANGAVARLSGEGVRLNERALMRTPQWRRIASTLAEALVPYPEAAKAVSEALERLDGASE